MINDRIAFLITALNHNANSFADQLGVSATVIYNIIKGRRNKPSYDLLLKIISVFHHINTDWLIKGEGENWFNPDPVEPPTEKLIEKIKFLVKAVLNDDTASPEAHELAELAQVLRDDYQVKQKELTILKHQNDQIMMLLQRQMKIKI